MLISVSRSSSSYTGYGRGWRGRDEQTLRLSLLPPLPPPLPSVLLPCCRNVAAAGELGREIDLSHLDDLLTSGISNRSIYFANIFRPWMDDALPLSLIKAKLARRNEYLFTLGVRIVLCIPKNRQSPTNNSRFSTRSSFQTLNLAACNLACSSALSRRR